MTNLPIFSHYYNPNSIFFFRNEVWRYHPGFGTKTQRYKFIFFRGFKMGLILAVGTAFLEKALAGPDNHGHH